MDEPLPDRMTVGQRYRPAMEMTDQADADRYFERLVERLMRIGLMERVKAEEIERSNLGYFAGYYNHETRERVERLFNCKHPVFGSIAEKGPPSVLGALAAGLADGHFVRRKNLAGET